MLFNQIFIKNDKLEILSTNENLNIQLTCKGSPVRFSATSTAKALARGAVRPEAAYSPASTQSGQVFSPKHFNFWKTKWKLGYVYIICRHYLVVNLAGIVIPTTKSIINLLLHYYNFVHLLPFNQFIQVNIMFRTCTDGKGKIGYLTYHYMIIMLLFVCQKTGKQII